MKDCIGNDITEGHYLVSKTSYDDLSYRLHPEEAYFVTYNFGWDEDNDTWDAYRKYNRNRTCVSVQDLVYRQGYVCVTKDTFNKEAMMQARLKKAEWEKEDGLKDFEKRRAAYLESLKPKPVKSFWQRLVNLWA